MMKEWSRRLHAVGGRQASAKLGPVRMTAQIQHRVLHAADTIFGRDECFGGDRLGHWNVARINRILDAMSAPIVHLPIPADTRMAMARVGAPDPNKAQLYAIMGVASMPPLSFVQMPGGAPDEVRQMMVDGHHRMLALVHLAVDVPARILPASLADDVRIVEMSEIAVFPDPAFGTLQQAELGMAERGVT